ncbi:Probable ATP-dependent helicase dinG homolog [Serratia rubidaea]|uniref:Probable ATP-dependent helicase dinG homolog n=1 Tax=Serratia rubidaea TaxID=61652 RepID=A0A4U9HJT1_SERRU|nr:Probable ATP-dependent helicase dinG homolog [Serratia rubidaea]
MAEAVAEAINFKQELVVEAGTGTGKTFAYLAPALRSNKKVIISTGSKALQDQLYARDLPTIAKALQFKGKLALLKGRSNYLCLERLEQQSLAGGETGGPDADRSGAAARLVVADRGRRYQQLQRRGRRQLCLAAGDQHQ